MTLASKVGTCWSIAQSKPYLRPMVPSMMGRVSPDLLSRPRTRQAERGCFGISIGIQHDAAVVDRGNWRFSTLRALVASTTVEKGVVPGVPTMPWELAPQAEQSGVHVVGNGLTASLACMGITPRLASIRSLLSVR